MKEKMTYKEAVKEAKEFVKEVDLEPGETEAAWIETYVEALREDGLIEE